MKSFRTYAEAIQCATHLASFGREIGVEKAREFGSTVFNVFQLPRPENRSGHELTCEVVRANQPDTTQS